MPICSLLHPHCSSDSTHGSMSICGLTVQVHYLTILVREYSPSRSTSTRRLTVQFHKYSLFYFVSTRGLTSQVMEYSPMYSMSTHGVTVQLHKNSLFNCMSRDSV
ncbi:hypothetical protein NP493_199g06061 [Ridgeia piscesae]|uniref:Uncharacterized protein n=1 Tax=Ridgeia piscesae TaxID=27915 RepID=A0AAD9P1P2_RIDPI|nr:hypothetical protein NP493_199g06061 [Ridgeia piscesae]